MKTKRFKSRAARREPDAVGLMAKTIVEREFLQGLENQARMYSVDLDFLTARILEMGLMAWTQLEPYQVQALLIAAKRLSPSMTKGANGRQVLLPKRRQAKIMLREVA